MKKITLLSLCIFGVNSFAQNAETFKIEKLSAPKEYLDMRSSKNIFSDDFNFGNLVEKELPDGSYEEEWISIDIEQQSELPDSLISLEREHSVLYGFRVAYQQHRPITISPDIIWLLINQGFSRHIVNNAEKFRKDFVNFDGKKDLIIDVDSSDIMIGKENSHWEIVFPQFVNKISDYVGKEVTDILTADFSTTTPASKIAGQMTIMNAFKEYFRYEIDGYGCGLPQVTIEGTVEDWEKVLAKTQYISKYDLKWWTDELKPILKQIIQAKKGKFDKKFWINMIKYHSAQDYGDEDRIDGWFVKFYPYDKEGNRTNLKTINDINNLPSEIVRVPFIFENRIDMKNVKRYQMEFWAGFFGLSQSKDFTLKPKIGWAIINKGLIEK
jgi:hypothetical protein